MNDNDVTYYVKNKHTFGFVFNSQPDVLGVLAKKPQLGAVFGDEPQMILPTDEMKLATREDFDFFRVNVPSSYEHKL